MKILLVNTRHFRGGGDSTYTFNLADLLRRKGHEVAFFAMQDERNLPDPNSDLFVSHIDFRELNKKKSIAAGIRVASRAIYSVEARRKFASLLDRFHPDIVHLQNIHGHITPSVIFEAKKRGLPIVWTLHDYKMICPNTHFLNDPNNQICEACGNGRYYQAVLKRCKKGSILASAMAALEAYVHGIIGVRNAPDYFLTPSSFLRNKLLERGFSPDKVKHIPLFLPDEMFNGSSQDKAYLLFMGKLDPLKGIYPLFAACKQAPKVSLKIAGRAEDMIAEKLPSLLPPHAEYVGMKQGEELRQLLFGSRAVVLPSLWYENQPFSILEAFAAGKPVIASELGGMTELVEHRERGMLVPPGNAKSLADAMTWMAEHPQESQEMGRRAREYALQAHSADAHYNKLMEVYEQIMRQV
jgi:glycosyltransferase involved in cell wall biosynthesis